MACRRFGLLLLLLCAAPLCAQVPDFYKGPGDVRGCIGGSRCGGRNAALRVPLENRRVEEVTFRAHDNIGGSRDGRLRIRIDSEWIESSLDVARSPQLYTVDARGVRGRELVFEPASDDEVEITEVRVRYADGGGGGGGGADHEGGCIGARRCGGSRSSLRIPLRSRPVREITFSAHDDIGGSRDGRLRVRIDSEWIEPSLDISRSRGSYTVDGRGLRGRELVIEPASNDEVEVRDIRIEYEGERGRRLDPTLPIDLGQRGEEGGCIGGRRCGGSRAAIRIPLRSRALREVTFEAHDDIGDSRGGRLLVRVDSQVIERSLEISRSRERYTLDVEGIRGRELVFEPASDDEVEVRDIQVRYR